MDSLLPSKDEFSENPHFAKLQHFHPARGEPVASAIGSGFAEASANGGEINTILKNLVATG